MLIRLLYPLKGNPKLELPDDAKYSHLIEQISRLTDLQEEDIILKKGFPPVSIDASKETVVNTVLETGESIIVQNGNRTGFQSHTRRPIPKYILKENSENSRRINCNTLESTHNQSSKRVKKPKQESNNAKDDDWAENIVTIFNQNSKNLNSAEKALKGVFKDAVQRRYRSVQAEKRWASVQGSTYKIELTPPYRFIVSYPTGPRSKSREKYIAFPKELIKPILEEAYTSSESSKMNLRPYYLAEAQPLIFWNLVRIFDGNIKRGYLEALPDLDWSFIDNRHRELSEKAKENLEQNFQNEKKRKESSSRKKINTRKKLKEEPEEAQLQQKEKACT